MTTPPTPTTPRVAALAPPYSGPVAAALERIMPAGVPPLALFRTLAVNERVFLRVMAGGLLDRGSIGLRDREIVIDRACARCGSEYEWGVHVALFAARVGLTPEQVAATRGDEATATAFPARERQLLRLVDELHDGAQVSDNLWAALRREWSEEQLIELVALTGFYHLISFVTNALRVPLEAYGARFPTASRDGADDRRSPPASPSRTG
ncbi:MAG TPA: carboxymuconolactone decarboxylase family protein [Candidatus Dormibacteraeota bacterium]|jgi:4-carboxymuconolactone decarboxylase|nr:carboxymuconolactone decarboxylase family protein [Candidatus Dormibacteraeota bacterium]